jgi:glycosyltransferase involved in cell wall biosynthesis
VESNKHTAKAYKVLMIAPTSFFSDYGCSVRILEEVRALQRQGHTVAVCTYRNGQDLQGVQIRRTPSIPFRKHYQVGSSPHKIAFDFLLFWTTLSAALRLRPDVIHGHMHEGALIGLVISRLLGIPMVFDFQGSLTGEMMDHKFLSPKSPFFRPLRWLERAIDQRSPIILTSSHNAKSILTNQFGVAPDRIRPLVDCVDGDIFFPGHQLDPDIVSKQRSSLGIPPGRQVVVYLGLLADYQGTDTLLQAAAKVVEHRDDVHFLIMGFPAIEHYRRMAQRLGLAEHTTFPGKIPYHQAQRYLALGNLAVAPKLSATEASGKILNYMAMGLPTVAFATPVSREYLGNEGIYAEPGDASSLAAALLDGLERLPAPELGHRLRQIALQDYSWDRTVQQLIRAYELVCTGTPAVL